MASACSRIKILLVGEKETDRAAVKNLFGQIPAYLEAAKTEENERVYAEYAFEEAHNGMAAVEYLERGNTCDLIFVDNNMPVMNGYEATRLIRSLGVRTPIVALSSINLQCDKDLFRYLGADDYYQKPISTTTVACILVTWIGLSKLFSNRSSDLTKSTKRRRDQT